MFGMNGFHVSASGAIQGHHGPLFFKYVRDIPKNNNQRFHTYLAGNMDQECTQDFAYVGVTHAVSKLTFDGHLHMKFWISHKSDPELGQQPKQSQFLQMAMRKHQS